MCERVCECVCVNTHDDSQLTRVARFSLSSLLKPSRVLLSEVSSRAG